jgi:hypothetical protein
MGLYLSHGHLDPRTVAQQDPVSVWYSALSIVLPLNGMQSVIGVQLSSNCPKVARLTCTSVAGRFVGGETGTGSVRRKLVNSTDDYESVAVGQLRAMPCERYVDSRPRRFNESSLQSGTRVFSAVCTPRTSTFGTNDAEKKEERTAKKLRTSPVRPASLPDRGYPQETRSLGRNPRS